jgi:hypothetical protein
MTGPLTASINHWFKSRIPDSTQYVVKFFFKVLVCEWEQYQLISVLTLLCTSQRTLTLHMLCIYHLPPVNSVHFIVSLIVAAVTEAPSHPLGIQSLFFPRSSTYRISNRASKRFKLLKDEDFVCDKTAVLRDMIKGTFNNEMPQHRAQTKLRPAQLYVWDYWDYDGYMKQSFLRSEYLFSCSTNYSYFMFNPPNLSCVHNSSPSTSILSLIKTAHTITSYFFKLPFEYYRPIYA